MPTSPAHIARLLLKKQEEPLSAEEEVLLQEALNHPDRYPGWPEDVVDERTILDWYINEQRWKEKNLRDKIFSKIREGIDSSEAHTNETGKIIRPRWGNRFRWMAAAAVILAFVAGVYFLNTNPESGMPGVAVTEAEKIFPGREGALLTLSDGTTVLLDTIQDGEIILKGGAVARVINGALRYEPLASPAAETYNTISTPKGRQYHLVLPDGSGVWLNSASSIRFPMAFANNSRRVQVEGEVYFEVVKKNGAPFVVATYNGSEIEVLGTRFNVNSYRNEKQIKTTLAEGSVKVSAAGKELVIAPGQQAALDVGGAAGEADLHLNTSVDVPGIIAWKNGVFNFDGVGVEELMRQLERWYDIEVVYPDGLPEQEFVGKLTRNIPLNDLLLILEKTNVHFRLEARKLIVLKR